MPLTPGSRLGPYQIIATIGAGGMGEVSRARDTKLRREVALKVLPPAFASDPERMGRFEREAHVLAALSHPNIASIYGIEESEGTRALVMELVEGPTLAERIQPGPIPFDESLEIAKQLADAIEYAHDRGVIHRDLKPANIKITPDGTVKVLDFGLAKALTGDLEPAPGAISHSPTLSPTLSMRATQAGMILGTAAYMAPEQAKGKAVDRRADIWAFGVVLFEMLTGQALFTGDSTTEIIASALKEAPKLEKLPAATPPAVRKLIERCLHKDPKLRLQSIGEARIVLSGPWEEPAPATTSQPNALTVPRTRRMSGMPWAAALGMCVVGLAGISFVHFRETPPAAQTLRFQIAPPGAFQLGFPSLSPDGRHLAFVTNNEGRLQLWIRPLDTLESRALPGTDGATYPFWSPDGGYLGFFQQGKLKKVAIAGGPAQTLCEATNGRGGTWNRDGVIVFSPGPTSELFRVSSAGGTPSAVTHVPGTGAGHRFPAFLPDGVHFLYNAGSDKPESAGLFVGSLDGGKPARLLPDATNGLFAASAMRGTTGYLLFRREDTLMAQPFDWKTIKTTGETFPLAEQVLGGGNIGFGAFSVSTNGVLVYRSGGAVANRELVWMDRAGKRLSVASKPGALVGTLAISPDDKAVAVEIGTLNQDDIWVQDLQRDTISRFTFRSGGNRGQVWSPDGSHIIYAFQDANTYSSDLYRKPTAGTGQEELLLHAGVNALPHDWSRDGKVLVFSQTDQKTATDLWLLPMDGTSKPMPYLRTPFDETGGVFSPDSKWMAYTSNESGQNQVYIQAVPATGAKWQISTTGGTRPQWRTDGKELFYVAADSKLMSVAIKLGASVDPATPQALFSSAGATAYAPSRDGQRFLVDVPAGGEAATVPPLTVVVNWQGERKK
jgi:serine/threonine protein kinase/Tol biopolymer transport system component